MFVFITNLDLLTKWETVQCLEVKCKNELQICLTRVFDDAHVVSQLALDLERAVDVLPAVLAPGVARPARLVVRAHVAPDNCQGA